MSISEYKISLKVRSMARRKRSNTRACPLSLSLIACSIFLFGERGKSVPRLARKGPWNRIMLDRDTLCTLRIPTYTRCKYTRECIIYLYTAPALSACNWSKARLVPPLGWTNGYAQAKANPCASSTSSFSFSTTSSSSNDLHLLLRSKIFASDVTVVELEILFFFFFFFSFSFRIYTGPLGNECGPACARAFSTGRKILIEVMQQFSRVRRFEAFASWRRE